MFHQKSFQKIRYLRKTVTVEFQPVCTWFRNNVEIVEKEVAKTLPDTLKEATLVKFKSFYYFESRTNKKAKDNLTARKGSWIQFYKNGVPLGKAFENINDGVYFPAISLFKTAKVKWFLCTSYNNPLLQVKVNFGPEWKSQPKTEHKLNSFHEQGFKGEIHQSVSDLLFAVDLKINGIIQAQC